MNVDNQLNSKLVGSITYTEHPFVNEDEADKLSLPSKCRAKHVAASVSYCASALTLAKMCRSLPVCLLNGFHQGKVFLLRHRHDLN